jgi:hypothetical protein
MALIGVTACAAAVGKSAGTISKHAKAGKIPVADRDGNGAPLFDVDQVRHAYENGINPLMRRHGDAVQPGDAVPAFDPEEGAAPERRSVPAAPRGLSGLQQQVVTEKQLKNRRLVRQIGEDEGRLVLRAVVDDEQTTLARRTRDSVTGFMGDKASAAYAFAGTPRTEADWRVWLLERTREAFNHFAAALDLEDDDEFGEHDVDRDPGDSQPDAIP